MCGLAGLWTNEASEGRALNQSVLQMCTKIAHRGPDGAGLWTDASSGFGVGFRRLAIMDLSSAGDQPMTSSSGRYIIVFNGEVYNFAELRNELESLGHKFRGHSDTEVILAAIESWGIVAAVQRFIGMFAIAVWDSQMKELSLIRDRLGIKPLYYGNIPGGLIFGSELKAFRTYPNFSADLDMEALGLYFHLAYIPAPYTIYRNAKKLPPGTILRIKDPILSLPEPMPYWKASDVVSSGLSYPFTGSDVEAEERLDALLTDAVRLRMIADVPVGAFLSGGVDSSLVVALMQKCATAQVKTFSIGFDDKNYDEAPYARAVAKHLCSDHTEMYITASEARATIPMLPKIWDEPFADASQIPTFLVSQLARKNVTVSLSGDGGDELFFGYDRYVRAQRFWENMHAVPAFGRQIASKLLHVAPRILPGRNVINQRAELLSELLEATDPLYFYQSIVSRASTARHTTRVRPDIPAYAGVRSVLQSRIFEQMMHADLVTYLPDDILMKVDRASMAVGLEARVPLLDHRVVELVWSLPHKMKIRDQQRKWLLKRVLERYVPQALVERPKKGFGIPLAEWLSGDLRSWADEMLDPVAMNRDGILDADATRRVWEKFLSGNWHLQYQVWHLVMFQAWRHEWM